jgi:hypothetical protein
MGLARHCRLRHRTQVGAEEEIAQGIASPVGDPTLPQVVGAVVQQVAALAQAAQIAQPVVARIMIEVGGGSTTRVVRTRVASMRSGQRAVRPRRSRHVVWAGSNQRPSGRHRISAPCGRPQPWQTPAARVKRTSRLSSGQFRGYSARRSLRIGMTVDQFVQAEGESAERFYDRVLAEAGEAPFVVFGGLQDQGELPPIYRSEL